jgi:N-acetylglucosaminyldiphosphoundecaprenol N-acetyl-beta-D-mannosaminyltransferase
MVTSNPDSKPGRAPIAILGVPFDSVTLDDALVLAGEMIARRTPHYATIIGVDFLAETLDDVELRRILFDAHLVIAEDKTVVWASKMLGNELPGCVTVPGFIPRLLALAEQNNWGVFFLGVDDATAAKITARHPKLTRTASYLPPEKPLLDMDHHEILRRIREAKPDILLVAFGSPKQEKWINMNFREVGVPFVLGTGVAFDFASGAGSKKSGGTKFWKFMRAVARQWHRLRARKKSTPLPPDAAVIPDPHGNLIIRAPARLGAAEAQAFRAEWQRAVENSNVMFDLSDTTFIDSTGVGTLIRLRRRSRELGYQFYLIAPTHAVAAALKLMKLEDFFTIQASMAGVRILMESAVGSTPVSSGVAAGELQIRWSGEVTVLNAVELGAYTESELSQATPGMTVSIDLSRVTFVDSTGIGLMVRFKKNLKRRDVDLKFINATGPVRNVVRQTQLEEFLMGATN